MADLEQEKLVEVIRLARKLSSVAPMLKSSMYIMQLNGDTPSHLAIFAKKADGGGRLGAKWELGEFVSDLESLGKLLHSEDELTEQSAGGIAAIFGGGGR